MAEILEKNEKSQDPILTYRRKQKYRFFRFGLISIVFIAGLVGLFVMIQNKVAVLRAKNTDGKWLLASLDNIAELNRDHEEAAQAFAELQAVLPKALDVPDKVVSELKQIAQARAVKLDLVVGSEHPGSDGDAGSLDFSLSGQGTLQSLAALFADFEKSKYIIQLTEWRFTPFGSGDTYDLIAAGTIATRPQQP